MSVSETVIWPISLIDASCWSILKFTKKNCLYVYDNGIWYVGGVWSPFSSIYGRIEATLPHYTVKILTSVIPVASATFQTKPELNTRHPVQKANGRARKHYINGESVTQWYMITHWVTLNVKCKICAIYITCVSIHKPISQLYRILRQFWKMMLMTPSLGDHLSEVIWWNLLSTLWLVGSVPLNDNNNGTSALLSYEICRVYLYTPF